MNRSPKYLTKLIELKESLGLKGGVFDVDVFHDEGCALLRETGACDCDPDVQIRDTHRAKN